jgi:hypothetical protein
MEVCNIAEGLAVYRLAPMQRWVRIKWEDQKRGDFILRIWYNGGDIESIQSYNVLEPPDINKSGCPVLCDETPLI